MKKQEKTPGNLELNEIEANNLPGRVQNTGLRKLKEYSENFNKETVGIKKGHRNHKKE